MEGEDFITFYHVTFQGNLKGIQNANALLTIGDPNNIGLINSVENQGYLEDSEGRVFATTAWFTVVCYINDIKERAERMGNESILKFLVVLKITIPLVDFNVLYSRKPEPRTRPINLAELSCVNGEPNSGSSHYFISSYEPAISLQYLSIAVSRIYRLDRNRQGEYQFGRNWWWMSLSDFDFQEGIYPVVPDAPCPRTNTIIDINRIVHDAVMKEMSS